MNKLMNCPYCGKPPIKKYLPDRKEYITCSNENCVCQPMTVAYKSKGVAARFWNTRNGQ